MARADLMLFGHVVEFEPAVLAVHDALGTQDVAVVAAVELVEHVLKSFLAELLRRLLAPGGEDVVGVVMMVMVALALGIVALLTVVVMVVMLVLVVLVVLVMVMVVMMPMLMFVLVMFIVIVMVVMLMLVLGLFDLVLAAHLFKKLVAQRHLFDGGEDGLAVQLVPRSRQNGGVGVLLAQHRGGSLELFLRELLRTGKNDRAGGLDLVVVELTEVLHIDLDLAGVGHGDIAVELELARALVDGALDGDDDVRELADAARLNEDAVGVELRHDLLECLVEVTDEGAADAARGHLGDLDARLLQKAAVDVDLAEFVLDQHELFAAVGCRDQLFDERGLAGAQKAGENVNFRHKKYASFFFIDFQTYIISRICERFKSFSTQNAPFSRSQAHTGQRHTMI